MLDLLFSESILRRDSNLLDEQGRTGSYSEAHFYTAKAYKVIGVPVALLEV